MHLDLRYWGKSGAVAVPGGTALSFAPNLARPKVFFDQELKNPLKFREAISALHEVVIGDFKYRPKDRTAYRAYLAEQAKQEAAIRKVHYDRALADEVKRFTNQPPRPNLDADFRRMHRLYWDARVRWANELSRNDPDLFRALVPCDPVVTVAPDVVFFECFSKDESSYGCLFADRDAFAGSGEAGLGTTNVDYSVALYDHFQGLRTYRPTRLQVDPAGFQVDVRGQELYREEKIDLPPSWLRGFGQLQGAMALPSRRVVLSLDVLYSLLAYLQRHREKTGPRSLLFRLEPGKPPTVVLEPWGVELESRGPPYQGPKPEELKVWGRRRLSVLSRLLPMAESVEVQLLGSGLPSVWTLRLGELRFVLALSGWSQNDWTSGAALELLSGDWRADTAVMGSVEKLLIEKRSASLAELTTHAATDTKTLMGSLHTLSQQGQIVYDFAAGLYRYRPVMPVALSEAVVGPEPEEVLAGKRLAQNGEVSLRREELLTQGRTLYQADVNRQACEALIDLDGAMSKAKCGCSHFRRFAMRKGPCRHLLALRLSLRASPTAHKRGTLLH